MKKLLLILLAFSGSTYAMEKAFTWERQKEESGRQLLDLLNKLWHSADIPTEEMKKIENLIAQGADINFNNGKETVLMAATRTDNPEVVRLILAQKPDLATVSNDGYEVLSYYISHLYFGQPDARIIKLLIENGANVNFKTPDGKTPLIIAATNGYPEIVKLLLAGRHGPFSPKLQKLRQEERAYSYLGLLPQELMEPIAHYVESESADPNTTDAEGNTALYYASKRLAKVLKEPDYYVHVNELIRNLKEVISLLEPVTTKK